MRSRRAGFTLLEVLAVILLTGIVLTAAITNYINLSRGSNRAADHTRDVRRATAVLDRVARDFERAILVRKPPELDPLAHPWLFFAESDLAENGSDRIKFVTRNYRPRRTDAHEWDLAMVAYTVRASEEHDGTVELWRWTRTQLPESQDLTFPSPDDDANFLMAEGLASFAVSFVSEEGELSDTWDSTQLVESSELPLAVEIRVALGDADADELGEPQVFSRRVLLPVRPLDLQALLDEEDGTGSGDDDEEGEDGDEEAALTVGDCIDFARASADAASNPALQEVLPVAQSMAGQSWDTLAAFANSFRSYVRPECQ